MPPENEDGAGIDFSDEGLEARLVDSEFDPAPPASELEADLPPAQDDAPVAADEGQKVPDPVAEDEPPAETAEEKTYRQRYEHQQEILDRQANELGELRRFVEQMAVAPVEDANVELPFGSPETFDDLMDLANEQPDQAFAFAIEHAPDTIPHVLAEIRNTDPAMAESFGLHYNQLMIQGAMQEVRQHVDQRVQPLDVMQGSAHQKGAVDAVAGQYADFDDLREDVARIVNAKGASLFTGTSPMEIAAGVDRAYHEAKSTRYDALVQAQAIQAQQFAAGAVAAGVVNEGGAVVQAGEVETTAEDDIRNGIFEANKSLVW